MLLCVSTFRTNNSLLTSYKSINIKSHYFHSKKWTKSVANDQNISTNINNNNVKLDIDTPLKRVKRKVAMIFAYTGTNYYGLQIDVSGQVETIEAVIERELYNLQCIKETNLNDLTKISWSRASRTDKGP